MSMATEGKRNALGVLTQNRFQATVPRKRVPKETVHRDGRYKPRKCQAVKRRMVGHHNRAFSPGQGFLEVSIERGNYLRREFLVVQGPADESAVIVSASSKHLAPQPFFPVMNSRPQLINRPGVIVPVDRADHGQGRFFDNQRTVIQIKKAVIAANLREMIAINLERIAARIV